MAFLASGGSTPSLAPVAEAGPRASAGKACHLSLHLLNGRPILDRLMDGGGREQSHQAIEGSSKISFIFRF